MIYFFLLYYLLFTFFKIKTFYFSHCSSWIHSVMTHYFILLTFLRCHSVLHTSFTPVCALVNFVLTRPVRTSCKGKFDLLPEHQAESLLELLSFCNTSSMLQSLKVSDLNLQTAHFLSAAAAGGYLTSAPRSVTQHHKTNTHLSEHARQVCAQVKALPHSVRLFTVTSGSYSS